MLTFGDAISQSLLIFLSDVFKGILNIPIFAMIPIFSTVLTFCENHNIFPSFPSRLPSFQASVTLAPAVLNGPRGLIFGIRIGLDPNSTLFDKLRS